MSEARRRLEEARERVLALEAESIRVRLACDVALKYIAQLEQQNHQFRVACAMASGCKHHGTCEACSARFQAVLK